MSKFIAFPVGQGDAFYLERDNFNGLVDTYYLLISLCNLLLV